MRTSTAFDIGDHVVLGLRPGVTLHPRDQSLLGQLRPIGVALFAGNFAHDEPYDAWLEEHRKLISSIREAVGRERLILAIDHEGGRVCRTPPPITRFASARSWANCAAEVGNAMGIELASLGINLNFAPVLDVDSNADNPIIGDRALSHDPNAVIEAATRFVLALESEGVRACGKHFPGHGDTSIDSHLDLPFVDSSMEELASRELRPFEALILAGIGVLMTSHIVFRSLDSALPATMSKKVVAELLRVRLGFEGVVITDDIGMRAMDRFFADSSAPARCLAAGNDLLMICSHWTDTDLALTFASSVDRALLSGELTESDLEASRRRVAAFLESTSQNEVRHLSDRAFEVSRTSAPLFEL